MQDLIRAIGAAILLLTVSVTASAQSDDGFTYKQLQSAFQRSGLTAQRLDSIQTFGSQGAATPAYIAVLSSSRRGWQVSVFHRVRSGFKLEWTSHALPQEFDVSSPFLLQVSYLGEEREPIIMFSGCARHLCGGTTGVGGVVLYSTLRKQAFFAQYSGINGHSDSEFTLQFSKNALEDDNHAYKEKLQQAIDALPHT